MSRITCTAEGLSAPCYCDCGHLSSWHVITERWLARCLHEGCICAWGDVCDCLTDGPGEDDVKVLREMGIRS